MTAKQTVNLDALIARQDLESGTPGAAGQRKDIQVSELALGRLHFALLRKPDFQRETDDWDIDNVVTLIKSFRDGDLIPAIIMWQAEQGLHYVIDGAHRLSALIAWVNDDYGDRETSQKFYDYKVSEQQKRIAQTCRVRVASEVGTYADLSNVNQTAQADERLKWASNISASLTTQWVSGDAEVAEKSFIAINQRSVQINETEKYMIEARRKPNVLAARALIRCATGHEYWAKFSPANKESIKGKAKQVFDVLFEPQNADLLKTIEMPIAGKPHLPDAVRLALEIINAANDLRTDKEISALENDDDGSKTARFLDKTFAVVKYLSGENPASLGLHPAVYFWGATGNHHPSAFLAVVSLIKSFVAGEKLHEFIRHRADFEEFLVSCPLIVKHVLGAYGGWKKSAPTVLTLYQLVLAGCVSQKSFEEIEKDVLNHPRFTNLKELVQIDPKPTKSISRSVKLSKRREEMLKAALRCAICFARLPSTSMSDDHIRREQDGGLGTESNVQLTHRYCNHGFKERAHQQGEALPVRPAWLA